MARREPVRRSLDSPRGAGTQREVRRAERPLWQDMLILAAIVALGIAALAIDTFW